MKILHQAEPDPLLSHGIGILDDVEDREEDLGIVTEVEVMDQVGVAAGISVRSYDVMLGTVKRHIVRGGEGEVLGFELPRGRGVLLLQPLLSSLEDLSIGKVIRLLEQFATSAESNKGVISKIYSTEPETLSLALISCTGVPPRAVIGSDPTLLLVE